MTTPTRLQLYSIDTPTPILGGAVLEWYPLHPPSALTLYVPSHIKKEGSGEYLSQEGAYDTMPLNPLDYNDREVYRQIHTRLGIKAPHAVWVPLANLNLSRTPLQWQLIPALDAEAGATTDQPLREGQHVSVECLPGPSGYFSTFLNTSNWCHSNPITAPTGLSSFVLAVHLV